MQASHEWSTRPDDQRFISLPAMAGFLQSARQRSDARVVSSRHIEIAPKPGDELTGIVVSPLGDAVPYEPNHWAFGQLATLAGAPAGYLRTMPAPIAADCLNYGLKYARDVEEVGILTQRGVNWDVDTTVAARLMAATGPNYGRVWNSDLVGMLIERFGDGVNGTWRVPGEFGKAVTVDQRNTTLYASDRDIFVFLADEQNRIEIPNRRHGQPGSLARGFFVWNSDVGSKTLGAAFFLFDYVCCNRIVWGASQYQEVKIRHTSGAPDRWLEEVVPVLREYSEGSAKPVQQAIEDARARRVDDMSAFLTNRFSKKIAERAMALHADEEGRPAESRWDAVTAVTALARSIPHQNERVILERQAGDLLTA